MPIKYVFNGYYRSGTTLVWDILKQSNSKHIVFYEPMNPKLSSFIKIAQKKQAKPDSLHKKYLWNEYTQQSSQFIQKLKMQNTFKKYIFPKNQEELFMFFDVFHELKENVILQTNRFFFDIKESLNKYNFAYYHLIRNPYDIYDSLMKIYQQKSLGRKILGKIKYMGNPKSHIFAIDKIIDTVYLREKEPYGWNKFNSRNRILSQSFETFFMSWVYFNYFALKDSLGKNNIILYEDLIGNFKSIENLVIDSSFKELKFNLTRLEKKQIHPNSYTKDELKTLSTKLNIRYQYEFIIEEVLKAHEKIQHILQNP